MVKKYQARYKLALLILLANTFFVSNVSANNIVNKIKEVESQLGARVGVSVYDTASKELWNYKGDARFALMSTFKTLACAKLLFDVDKGTQSLDASVVISSNSLISWSPVTKKLVGQSYSLKQACSAAIIMSDNTAANIVLAGIKGPEGLTQFMQSIGDNVTRLDRIEPELNEALEGDKRDTTTPNAMVKNLNKLLFGDVLSPTSKTQLTQWMIDSKVTGSLLRSVLPYGWLIADKSGSGGFGSRGIVAVVWPQSHAPIIISIYLTQTETTFSQRNKAIADIGKEIFAQYIDKT
ncbi:MAG: class A beta-lactamase [Colwellia sp.]|nr:class A beta-lactamase [Colwellia sp.]